MELISEIINFPFKTKKKEEKQEKGTSCYTLSIKVNSIESDIDQWVD